MSAKTRSEIEKELIASGDYRPYALSYFNSQRAVYILMPVLAAAALAWVVPERYVVYVVVGGLVAALLGFSIPRAVVVYRGKQRGRQFDQGLPLAADLMVMCLGAGQTVPYALKRVANDVRNSKPVVGSELDLASRQADLRDLSFALWQLSDRVQTPNARNFAMVLAQGEKVGTDTLATLSEFATSLRHTQSLEVEARSNRLSFWMLLPTISCLWLAVAMILVGPAWLEMSNIGKIRDEIKRDQLVDITQTNSASSDSSSGRRPIPDRHL